MLLFPRLHFGTARLDFTSSLSLSAVIRFYNGNNKQLDILYDSCIVRRSPLGPFLQTKVTCLAEISSAVLGPRKMDATSCKPSGTRMVRMLPITSSYQLKGTASSGHVAIWGSCITFYHQANHSFRSPGAIPPIFLRYRG